MAALEVVYEAAVHWVHPILVALQAKPSLADKYAQWGQRRLSDLAFAIETRLGYLPEIIKSVDENLERLGNQLSQAADIDRYIQEGIAYRFQDLAALRRVLIGVSCFIAESRSVFENLADFLREFLAFFFSDNLAEKDSYEAIAQMAAGSDWAEQLRRIRHDLLHERSLWMRFDVDPRRKPRFEPEFLLNWRPGAVEQGDYVKLETLRAIRNGLAEAAELLRRRLIERLNRI